MINKLPIKELIHNYQNKFLSVKLDLDLGVEKPKNKFKKGDMAFSPSSNSFYIFLTDYTHYQQLSHVGFIKTENFEEFLKTKAGDLLTIQKV